MTLAEWTEIYREAAQPFDREGYEPMMTVADRTRSPDAAWDLFHLVDYLVTSVQGGTIWLAPSRLNPQRQT